MRCRECQRAYWPATACTEHGWAPMRWVPAAGTGVVQHLHRHPPRFHSDLIDCPVEDLRIGLPVEVTSEDTERGWVLPHFRPALERNP